MKKSFLCNVLVLTLVLLTLLASACGNIPDEEPQTPNNGNDSIVTILYTNDIHSYLNNDAEGQGLSYPHIAQMKKDIGDNVLLVDAGDHIQGSVYGAMDQGQTVLELMNTMYDVATLGNHEFDYGTERTLYLTNNSTYPYISCNFVYTENNERVLQPHLIKEVGNVKVGFVGITTPETLASTAPSYFQNDDGEFIYDFLDGQNLFDAVQMSIDELKSEGADYIIALGHLGVDALSQMTSRDVIQNTTGLSAFIDGHSHTEIIGELVTDKDGKQVTLTQTGCYLNSVGKMTINKNGITTELITEYDGTDATTLATKNEWVSAVDEMLGETIGQLDKELFVNDENGDRLVRVDSTNLGDFVADSYYYYANFVSQLDCDIAIINGGGLRAQLDVGKLSYMSLKSVNPFGNMLCVIELTGQQILDMLEWGARMTTGVAGQCETGAFLHTAGLTYTVDTAITSTVQMDDQGIWTGAPTGEYRVKNVKIYDKEAKAYVDIVLTETYTVMGSNFTLTSMGDGFAMLGGKVIKDYIVEDYMALATYTVAFEDVNNDNLSDISSANSPLRVYENYLINYESVEGANRVNVVTN